MNYSQAIDYLYTRTPLFQNVGAGAYKEGLSNTLALDDHFQHPHQHYTTIHVAGTNGKGSCSHTLASILQEAGYRVGLYTSPHLVDFRERIRVNGQMIPKRRVIDFIRRERRFFEPLSPSFFEVTTALAFKYFEEQHVDVAVIEVGLGGRLDCTNIIHPAFCIITNISLDHVQLLGDTPAKIAAEKAGIIKPGVPVVIGETTSETRPVFAARAAHQHAPVIFAEDAPLPSWAADCTDWHFELHGLCQSKNTNTLLHAAPLLMERFPQVTVEHVRRGFEHVIENTHLMGRWQQIAASPCPIVCDTGHNTGGFQYIADQLRRRPCHHLHVVLGMAADKDVHGILAMLPPSATYYFCQASVRRALNSTLLQQQAATCGLQGEAYPTVKAALRAARSHAASDDFIFIGGSTFVVADALAASISRP